MSAAGAQPPCAVRVPSSPSIGGGCGSAIAARPLRPRPHSTSSIPNALHHQLLNAGQRSRAHEVPHAFHDAVLRADTAPKSIRTFKGHAKGILRQLFFALLVRFFVLVVIAVGLAGSTAWFLWSHRGDSTIGFRIGSSVHRPTW